jgi:hypothetical protein
MKIWKAVESKVFRDSSLVNLLLITKDGISNIKLATGHWSIIELHQMTHSHNLKDVVSYE